MTSIYHNTPKHINIHINTSACYGPLVSELSVPEELIFDKFLHEYLEYPNMHPGGEFKFRDHRGAPDHPGCLEPGRWCFSGSIFNDGENIYRIGEYTNEHDCDSWHARWPD